MFARQALCHLSPSTSPYANKIFKKKGALKYHYTLLAYSFFVVLGFELRVSHLARQTLYHLSYATSLFPFLG
jgi:hypothetical protein